MLVLPFSVTLVHLRDDVDANNVLCVFLLDHLPLRSFRESDVALGRVEAGCFW